MKFSREALKLSDNMKSGFAMPISVLGTPKHSSEYKGVKTPDYLNDFCFEVLEDSGINLINCDSNSAEFGEITELADLHFIGTCDVKPNIEPLSISNDFIEYEKYLRDFCETKKPKYLSYINPLYTNIHKNTSYFHSKGIVLILDGFNISPSIFTIITLNLMLNFNSQSSIILSEINSKTSVVMFSLSKIFITSSVVMHSKIFFNVLVSAPTNPA